MMQHEIHAQMLMTLLSPIAELLGDEQVSEVMINGPTLIYCERKGQLERTALRFPSESALLAALRNIAQFVGRPLDAEHPILEGRLPDGSRIQALIAPVAPCGPSVSIRRFSRTPLTLQRMLAVGSLDERMAQLLQAAVLGKKNVLVSGGTGTGKTSLLNVLSSFIPDAERVVVIEDARELQLQREHVVQLETRPAHKPGQVELGVRELFRASLRMRPDRIVLGEIRGAEALELIAAMTSGHDGCMATVHASRPLDALSRLETMAMMSDLRLPLAAIRQQLASGLDVIVHVERNRGGARHITEICTVSGVDAGGNYRLAPWTDADSVDSRANAPEHRATHAHGLWSAERSG